MRKHHNAVKQVSQKSSRHQRAKKKITVVPRKKSSEQKLTKIPEMARCVAVVIKKYYSDATCQLWMKKSPEMARCVAVVIKKILQRSNVPTLEFPLIFAHI